MVEVYFFLINANHRPVHDSLEMVDVPDSLNMLHLRGRIQEHISQAYTESFRNLEIWQIRQYTGPESEFPEGDMPALEQKIKDAFNNDQVRKRGGRTKIRDLQIQDNESLLVEVSVSREIFYLTVDHRMRPTNEILVVNATEILGLIECAEVKRKSRDGPVIVWRSTARELSIRATLEDLTETIKHIDFNDRQQAVELSSGALATDVDRDDVLIVQVPASNGDEKRDTSFPLPSDVNLNADFQKTYLAIQSVKSPSVNSKSTEYSQNQSKDLNIIYDGLYAPSESAPNTSAPPLHIYHPIFWQFTRDANDPDINPDPAFLKLVRRFMANACNVGYSGMSSNKSMWEQLTDILQYPVEGYYDDTSPDGVIMYKHSEARIPMLIAEYKRSLGEGECDPSIQAGNAMRKALGQPKSKLIVDKCCCPVFMLAGGGPWFCVLGGVFANRLIVQRLTDMVWIGFATTHEEHRVYHVARVLLALWNSLRDLKRFYEFVVNTDKIPDFDAKARDPHPRHFPYPRSFIDGQGTLCIFEYLGRLVADMKCVTFLAKIKDTDKKIVVKFVDRYGAEVHRFLAEQGHAPQLLYYGPLPDRTIYDASETAPDDMKPMNAGYRQLGPGIAAEMKMVVMEYIPRSKPHLDDLKLSYRKISDVVELLRANGYVFGDLRGPNIMFDTEKNVKFIDFDWAGRYDVQDLSPEQQDSAKKTWARLANTKKSAAEEPEEPVTYPIGISSAISWAQGVGPWLPILPDHDNEMLTKLHECWLLSQ